MQRTKANNSTDKPVPVVSLITRAGEIVEMLFRRATGECRLVTDLGDVQEHESVEADGQRYVPYSATNNLITHRVLLLPSEVKAYESDDHLLLQVQAFIRRFVDLSEEFEEIAAHYVLMTWLYDKWSELPYLRVKGNYGSGKSRFLLVVGSICRKPIFASGASTVSPLFRLIDEVGGTLVIDEADFFASDERATIIKILNNGNARGFPVLRSEMTPTKEFSPRAFDIFGPKIVATRHDFADEALESRCLTEVMATKYVRRDIPVSLPDSFEEEAEDLRNKLLKYRFNHFYDEPSPMASTNGEMSARRAQILSPLLAVATSESARIRISKFGRKEERPPGRYRALLGAVHRLQSQGKNLTVGAIAEEIRHVLSASPSRVTDRSIGAALRSLGVHVQKSNGVFRIVPTELPRLEELFKAHGVDSGDVGDASGTGVAE